MRTNPNFKYYDVSPISSIKDLMRQAVTEAGSRTAFCFKRGKENVDISYQQFYDATGYLGAALTELGLEKKHIACAATNRYEWLLTYLTVLQSSNVFVPLDKDLPESDLLHLLNESDSEAVFFENARKDFFINHYKDMPRIKYFINFDATENNEVEEANADGVYFLSFDALIEHGKTLDVTAYRAQPSDPMALKMLVYTSGTTGKAKGVMLSEHNLCSSVYYGMQVSTVFTKSLSVLPYNHTYASVPEILVSLHKHATICINDSLIMVLKNLQLYKPDYIYLVPAFAEIFYRKIMKQIQSEKKEGAVKFMIKLSNFLRKFKIDIRKKVFHSIHEAFGGNMRKIVCGGAPIRPEIGQFFDDIGMPLIGGYGITECSPLVCVNPDSFNDWNTAGCPLPCIDWKINEPNEEGIGEVLVKGDIVMMGYYKQPELTEEVLKDGWFFTGDYGYITDKDQLVLTGRKSNIIVLSNGKNVYPEEIESRIQNLESVKEVVVYGKKDEIGYQSALVAEIYPADEDRILKIADNEDERAAMAAELLEEVRVAVEELPSYKHISEIVLRGEPFPKTSSNKIKRGALVKHGVNQ